MEREDGDKVIAEHPFGEILSVASTEYGVGTASFSKEYKYRYRLSRVWDISKPRVNFIMLNPSTANSKVLDPTVTRCAKYALSWGMGSLEVTNIFALRSTDPKKLILYTDPVGKGNDYALAAAAAAADLVIVAWGSNGHLYDRDKKVLNLLKKSDLFCLRVNKSTAPAHPLYLPSNLTPVRYKC
ncbi:MAG: DUF1643 domain-containing protein [Candidatus Paceibacterota bacterium]